MKGITGESGRLERSADRFGEAQKISPDDYQEDPVFWPDCGGAVSSMEGMTGDGFYANVADLLASCEEASVPPPAYVWTCFRDVPSSNSEWIIEDSLVSHYEGAGDNIAAEHRERLDAFLRQWWADSGVCTWRPDYKRAVVIGVDVALKRWRAI